MFGTGLPNDRNGRCFKVHCAINSGVDVVDALQYFCTPATNTELKAEQGFDELRLTTSKEHHQRMLYTPHCQTLVLPVTVNILQRRRLSGRLFEKLCHSPAETFGSQGS